MVLQQPESDAVNDRTGRDNSALLTQVLQSATEASGWFSADYTPDALSVVIQPIILNDRVIGTVRVEQMTNVIASLSNKTIVYLLGSSVLIFLGISGLLIGYASVLSMRISGLRKQVNASMTDAGQVVGDFQASAAKDEIGELSQQFALLFNAVKGYTQYLETFSQKLVHEIKTPVAIVSSSLDVLKDTLSESQSATQSKSESKTLQEVPSEDGLRKEAQVYIQRAQEGVARISQIINSLREATRLEKSINNTERTLFELNPLLAEIFSAYQLIDKSHRLSLALPPKPCIINGSAELIAQMLDKLFDNARGYTPTGGHIRFVLDCHKQAFRLRVENEGSRLPEDSTDIFDSFVTHRTENREGHMGLGLVIVKLIAHYHGGKVAAVNLPQNQGVCFSVSLPATGVPCKTP
jgi:signal transduction histidine kinase